MSHFTALIMAVTGQRGGNGLGLYLVSTILKSLDIPYSFSPSEDIEGMSFQIIF